MFVLQGLYCRVSLVSLFADRLLCLALQVLLLVLKRERIANIKLLFTGSLGVYEAHDSSVGDKPMRKHKGNYNLVIIHD